MSRAIPKIWIRLEEEYSSVAELEYLPIAVRSNAVVRNSGDVAKDQTDLGHDEAAPFLKADSQQWYRSVSEGAHSRSLSSRAPFNGGSKGYSRTAPPQAGTENPAGLQVIMRSMNGSSGIWWPIMLTVALLFICQNNKGAMVIWQPSYYAGARSAWMGRLVATYP